MVIKKKIRSALLLLMSNILSSRSLRKLTLAAILKLDADDMEFNGEMRAIEFARHSNLQNFIDVGANVGAWTRLVIRKVPNVTSICMYEPNDSYHKMLGCMSDQYKFVTLKPYAISSRDGSVGFNKCGVFSAIDHKSSNTVTSINCNGLKSLHESSVRYFVKIDTEGFDLEVLTELVNAGILGGSLIQIEYGKAQFDMGIIMNDYKKILPNHKMFLISQNGLYDPEIMCIYDFCIPLMNVLLVPNDGFYDITKF